MSTTFRRKFWTSLCSLGVLLCQANSAMALPRELKRAIEEDCPRLLSALPALSPAEKNELRDRLSVILKLNVISAADVSAPKVPRSSDYVGLWRSFTVAPERQQLECLLMVAERVPEIMSPVLPELVDLAVLPTIPAPLAERLDATSFLIARQTPALLVSEGLVRDLWNRFAEKATGLVAGILARLPRREVRQHLVTVVVGTSSDITLSADHAWLLAALDQDGGDLKQMLEKGLSATVQALLLSVRGPNHSGVSTRVPELELPPPARNQFYREELKTGTLEEQMRVVIALNAQPKIPPDLAGELGNFLKTRPVVGSVAAEVELVAAALRVLKPAAALEVLLRYKGVSELAGNSQELPRLQTLIRGFGGTSNGWANFLVSAADRGEGKVVIELLRKTIPLELLTQVLIDTAVRPKLQGVPESGLRPLVISELVALGEPARTIVRLDKRPAAKQLLELLTMLGNMEAPLGAAAVRFVGSLRCGELPAFAPLLLEERAALVSAFKEKMRTCLASGDPKSVRFAFELAAANTTVRQSLRIELQSVLAILPSGPDATLWQLRLFEVFLEREPWGSKLGAEVLKYPEMVLVEANDLERVVGQVLELNYESLLARLKFLLTEKTFSLKRFDRALLEFLLRRLGRSSDGIEVIKLLSKNQRVGVVHGEIELPETERVAWAMIPEGSTSERVAGYLVLGRFGSRSEKLQEFLMQRWASEAWGKAKFASGIACLRQLEDEAFKKQVEETILETRWAWDLAQELYPNRSADPRSWSTGWLPAR